jgi:signal transduction histidine kinase
MKTILLVDDEPLNLEYFKNILLQDSYQIEFANNAKDALDLLEQLDVIPDLILADINMPQMNGYDFCKEVKNNEKTKNIPFIFITTKGEVDDESLGFELGAIDYFHKPVSGPVILARIKNHLSFFNLLDNLNERVEIETNLRLKQEDLLIQQSKSATMGDMIDAIAHQWKQPLGLVDLRLQMLELELDNENLKEHAKKCIEMSTKQINHLVSTIDEFRSFFRITKDDVLECFDLDIAIKQTLDLLKDEIIQNTIQVETDLKEGIEVLGKVNEFKHIMINLINNAKDAFKENNINNKQILITLKDMERSHFIIEVSDNAGGINEDIIDNIFEPHITSKEDSGGTGIGLYLTQQIAHKFNLNIEVENINNGAKFIISNY